MPYLSVRVTSPSSWVLGRAIVLLATNLGFIPSNISDCFYSSTRSFSSFLPASELSFSFVVEVGVSV